MQADKTAIEKRQNNLVIRKDPNLSSREIKLKCKNILEIVKKLAEARPFHRRTRRQEEKMPSGTFQLILLLTTSEKQIRRIKKITIIKQIKIYGKAMKRSSGKTAVCFHYRNTTCSHPPSLSAASPTDRMIRPAHDRAVRAAHRTPVAT